MGCRGLGWSIWRLLLVTYGLPQLDGWTSWKWKKKKICSYACVPHNEVCAGRQMILVWDYRKGWKTEMEGRKREKGLEKCNDVMVRSADRTISVRFFFIIGPSSLRRGFRKIWSRSVSLNGRTPVGLGRFEYTTGLSTKFCRYRTSNVSLK